MKRKKLSDEEKQTLRFMKAMGGLPEVMRGFQKGMTYESELAEILYGNPYAKVDERQVIHDVCKRLEEEEKHSKFLNGWGGFDEFVRFFEEVLGRYSEEAKTLDELLDAIDQATLPQGCTWPKDRNGKSIKPNDPVHIYGEKMRIVAISHKDNLCIRPWNKANGGGGFWVKSSEVSLDQCGDGVCAEKKVLDADGEEIREGDKVWVVNDPYERSHVIGFCKDGDVKLSTQTNGVIYRAPDVLTHRAPVLAADGKPLREGETVWDIDGNGPLTVREIERSDDPDDQEHCVWCGESGGGFKIWRIADQLTHERPDSWELLQWDATNLAQGFEDIGWPEDIVERIRGLVRRAKKLAGVQ